MSFSAFSENCFRQIRHVDLDRCMVGGGTGNDTGRRCTCCCCCCCIHQGRIGWDNDIVPSQNRSAVLMIFDDCGCGGSAVVYRKRLLHSSYHSCLSSSIGVIVDVIIFGGVTIIPVATFSLRLWSKFL